MDVTKLESVIPELEPLVRRSVQARAEQPATKAAPPAPPKDDGPVDKVDVKSMRETSKENTDITLRSGKIYDYTVNSSHDLIIKVKDMSTMRELKEIPSKPHQAAKRGYHKVVDRILDRIA